MNYCPYCMNELAGDNTKCPRCGKDSADYKPLAHTLAQGTMLNNRYLVGGVIGEGGFGITYIGLDNLLQFRVAIKEFYPNGMVNRNNTVSNDVISLTADSAREVVSKSRENFLHEARMLAKFTKEAGIVAVRDFFEENKTVYIVMEYLDGITLKSYLKQVGTISCYNTVCLLMPVFKSLKKVHEQGLIHRDISPDNIMLVDEDVKLLDFGAAREFADEKSLSVMLKHGYAPMEQYRRHGTQGAWTDIYALCATMYKCITGEIPPDAPDRIYEDELKMPSELGIEGVTPEFEAVLKKGLAIKADDRIQSIDELLELLEAVPGFDLGIDIGETAPQTSAAQSRPEEKEEDEDKRNMRMSEYIPRSEEEDYEEPEPEPVNTAPAAPAAAQPSPEKGKSRLPVIIGGVGAAVAVIGVVLFLALGKNKPQNSDSSVNKGENTTTSATAAVSEEVPAETGTTTVTTAAALAPEESAAETTTETTTATSATTAAPPEKAYPKFPEEKIVIGNVTKFFYFDMGMMGKSMAECEEILGVDNSYEIKNYAYWLDDEYILHFPVNDGDEDTYINLCFENDALIMAEYAIDGTVDSVIKHNIKEAAIMEFEREPDYYDSVDSEWMLEDKKCLYQAYETELEGTAYFSQRYISYTLLYEQGILQEPDES